MFVLKKRTNANIIILILHVNNALMAIHQKQTEQMKFQFINVWTNNQKKTKYINNVQQHKEMITLVNKYAQNVLEIIKAFMVHLKMNKQIKVRLDNSVLII